MGSPITAWTCSTPFTTPHLPACLRLPHTTCLRWMLSVCTHGRRSTTTVPTSVYSCHHAPFTPHLPFSCHCTRTYYLLHTPFSATFLLPSFTSCYCIPFLSCVGSHSFRMEVSHCALHTLEPPHTPFRFTISSYLSLFLPPFPALYFVRS